MNAPSNSTAIANPPVSRYTEAVNKGAPATQPDFKKGDGLVPAVVQSADTGEVLMLAYMNREAWERTLRTGKAHYYSRSRGKQWMKGEESGNVQDVVSAALDCDSDTVLLKVKQRGGVTCHTGAETCFTGRDVPLTVTDKEDA